MACFFKLIMKIYNYSFFKVYLKWKKSSTISNIFFFKLFDVKFSDGLVLFYFVKIFHVVGKSKITSINANLQVNFGCLSIVFGG